MPELPEVETIVRSLRPLVTGRRILDVEFRSHDTNGALPPALRRILPDSPDDLLNSIRGAWVEGVRRHGKNLLFDLRRANGAGPARLLLIHLGMTGRLTCERTPEFRSAHTHLVLSLDEPGPVPSAVEGRWLHYTDIRQFGHWRLLDPSADELRSLGPDPLEIPFAEFAALLRPRRAMLKSLLLDQHFLRGLGNIYADESLFRARIHPTALAARLTREQAQRLYRGIRETLRLAIAAGGSSIANYVDGLGNAGYFQHEHLVYQRTGEPCLRCGCRIQKMLIASRGTHFCPRCQRAGKRGELLAKGKRWVASQSSAADESRGETKNMKQETLTFWEAIDDLRQRKLIPHQWRASDLIPHLQNDFSLKTIRTVPANQSISKDNKVKGNYVKRGQKPKAFRLGGGLYQLIDDPKS